jgi:predicted nuclease with TOPRIM domain
MPTPTKPFIVLKNEKKSHRTKKELKQRQQGEEALATGTALKERPEVKANKIAHKEFLRLNKLLKGIEKNDAIYESVINRYCMLQAECAMFDEKREELYKLIYDLENEYNKITENMDPGDKSPFYLEYSKNMAKLSTTMLNLDKQLQSKRKMLLDIEKENIMTIAAALRSIPKKPEKEENPLLKALNGS